MRVAMHFGYASDVDETMDAIWLPAGTLLAIILSDIADKDQLTPKLQEKLDALCSPFRNFLTLYDLDTIPGKPVESPPWKTRALASLAITQAAGWLAVALYAGLSADNALVVQCTISILSWVRIYCCCARNSALSESRRRMLL